jgi:pilus assembly protein CpaE
MSGMLLAFADDTFHTAASLGVDTGILGPIRRFSDGSAMSDKGLLFAAVTSMNPEVVTVGPDLDASAAVELVRELDRNFPEVGVILVHRPTAELWRAALVAGARDIIDPDSDPSTIASVIGRVSDLALDRRERIRGQRPALAVSPPHSPTGRTIVVVSPKGGSGKTVVATNVAVAMAKQRPGDVVLVDLDLQFGDVASSLSMTPQYTLYTATQASGPEATLLKAFLTPHPSQLLVMCAPEDPTEADDIKEGDVKRIVQELAKLFAFVIVDTGAGLDDLTLAMAELATDLVFVSSTDVPSVRGIRKEAQIMEQLGVKATRHFVLNRSDAKVGLSKEDISATTGLTVSAEVPSSRGVPTSVNVGIPIVEHDNRNPASRGLMQLAERFLADGKPEREAKGMKRFLR